MGNLTLNNSTAKNVAGRDININETPKSLVLKMRF